jgi:hypothetical protein
MANGAPRLVLQDCDFHPTLALLATGLIDGKLLLHEYSKEAVSQRTSLKAHGASCRAVRFALSGDLVISASTDQSLLAVDVETGTATARKKEAHDNAINRLAAVGQTVTASGAAVVAMARGRNRAGARAGGNRALCICGTAIEACRACLSPHCPLHLAPCLSPTMHGPGLLDRTSRSWMVSRMAHRLAALFLFPYLVLPCRR